MKSIIKILILIFLLNTLIISGCSSDTGDRLQNQQRDRQFQQDRPMNLTEEEMQQMFGERMQQMSEICEGLNEGDSCQFETPRGTMEGKCKLREDNLVCIGDMTDRPMGQRPE